MNEQFKIKLKGDALVCIDWANVYGWQKKLKRRRKCDFDIEIALDTFLNISNINSFILVSGDGDYEPLIKFCISERKQAIIVANPGNLGKEYKNIPNGLFVCNIKKIREFVENKYSREIAPPSVI